MLRSKPIVAATCLTLGLLGPACDGPEPPQPPILLVGVDGLEWDVMLPLIREGKLPHMAALMERGIYGELPTIDPTLSPVIWTTIATGKPPEQHGIRNFVKPARDGDYELFTNKDRRTKAFWNIASEYGRRVGIVGWWMTFPVEQVNGVMVAQTNTLEQIFGDDKQVWKGQLVEGLPGQVYPPDRQSEMLSIAAEVESSLSTSLEEIFGARPHPHSPLGKQLWSNCRWSFRADATYLGVAKRLLAEPEPYDLLAVYFGGPDVVGHRFWRYEYPEIYEHKPTAEELENYGDVIDDYYAYVDRSIGELVALAGADTRVVVVSDHGMVAVNQSADFDPTEALEKVNSAHHLLTRPPGVIIAAGPDINRLAAAKPPSELRRPDLGPCASVMDMAPTLLALMSIPIGEDMAGQVSGELLTPGFRERVPVRRISTHDTRAWIEMRLSLTGTDAGSAARLEQLRKLGYIGEQVQKD